MYPFAPHLPLRGPRLYILLHLLLVRFSVDLAQLEIEVRSSTGSPPRERPRPPWRRSYRIQDPLVGRSPRGFQGLLTEKNGSYVSLPLLTLDLVYLFVFFDLALV